MAKCRELLNKGLLQDIFREQMWVLSEVREKVCDFQKLPLDKSHFITEVRIMFAMQETIRPSADLRNHYNEISKQCREGKEAVIITVNGRGDTVSLSYEEYKNMKSRIELLEVLAEAEDDVKNGRVAPISETFDDLRAMLQEG